MVKVLQVGVFPDCAARETPEAIVTSVPEQVVPVKVPPSQSLIVMLLIFTFPVLQTLKASFT